jgi:beta-N-acetylhexosaminidase
LFTGKRKYFLILQANLSLMKRILFLVLAAFTFCPLYTAGQSVSPEDFWVDSVYHSLSPEERIAQLIIVRANDPGKNYFNNINKYIQEYNIGGVCFFRNHPQQQLTATRRWQDMAKTPLLVSIDAEWGLGMRLDSTIRFPFQMTLGAIRNNGLIYLMGQSIAMQCRRMGIHMNFAPVVDINSNPANPVIGMRSFGQDREQVMLKGLAYMQGLQENGIIATAKHFPGHGDTDTDSHKTLPLIFHSRERLDSVELYPFRQLIKMGLEGIMIAHLYIPALEAETGLASTLSPLIVSGLLKDELGFEGLIVTDALDMKGVTKHHKSGDIEVKALLAGNDILLLPSDVPKAIRAIVKAVKDGIIGREIIDTRCRKVLRYKYRAGLAERKNPNIKGLISDLNAPTYQALNRELFKASATLLRNDDNLIPLQRPDTIRMACVIVNDEGWIDNDFANTIALYGKADFFGLKTKTGQSETDRLLDELDPYNLVVTAIQGTNIHPADDYGISSQTWHFIRELSKGKKHILNIFASPYALQSLGTANLPDAIILSFQDSPLAAQAGAGLIFGGVPAEGKLPVDIGGLFVCGDGIETEASRLEFVDADWLGIDEKMLRKADSIALSGIILKAYPGCQVIAAKDGKIFYHKTFGYHTYNNKMPVKHTDLYDLASLTKIAATTLSVMKLSEEGWMDIDRRLSYYLPYLRSTNKKDIIIRELMAHQSALRGWIPYYRYTLDGQKPDLKIFTGNADEEHSIRVADGLYIRNDYAIAIIDSIRFSKLNNKQDYRYSDLGFYLLKEAIENITNIPFGNYTDKYFYSRMGLPNMGYNPLKTFGRERIVPTEYDSEFRQQLLWGDVHDQGAALLGGVSGHAGLFSNAFDMAAIMQMLLNGGIYGGIRYFDPGIVKEFTSMQFPLSNNRRGIGFDKPLPEYDEDGPCCKSASPSSFGHSGFTGTYAWADPENGLVYVFLSNRIHPDAGNNRIAEYNIRTNLHQVFYDALKQIEK